MKVDPTGHNQRSTFNNGMLEPDAGFHAPLVFQAHFRFDEFPN